MAYGGTQVLWGVDVRVAPAEIVTVLGTNGAGKSTILNAVSGLARALRGEVMFDGEQIGALPTYARVERGVSHVLERRRVFGFSSVEDNLRLGSVSARARRHAARNIERVYGLFPILRERRRQLAHSLSGGEQQMLAIGRGLMAEPRLLMIDEPFLGLAPAAVNLIARVFEEIRSHGVSVVFVEQNVRLALRISDRGYLVHAGRIAGEGPSRWLLDRPNLAEMMMGLVGSGTEPEALAAREERM